MDELAILGGNPTFDTNTIGRYKAFDKEEVSAVTRVMETGNLSGFLASWGEGFKGGEEVQKLELEWSKKFKTRNSVSVNSATSGIIAAVGAAGIGPGDEVIVPPTTMSATATSPLFYGGIPVFVDIEEDYFCLDVELVKKNINKKTKAIIAVNLFGQPASLHELRKVADENNLILIEDNAQGPTATENNIYTGTIGHIGVFSLNYHKHIHCGEGGICTTDDDELALKMELIRNHGEACVEEAGVNDLVNTIGTNLRLPEISAAVANQQLLKSERLVNDRIHLADKLNKGLSGLDGFEIPKIRDNSRHVYYMWQARVNSEIIGVHREVFAKALNEEGFPNFTGYLPPLYWLPVFQNKIAIGDKGFPFNLNPDISYEKGLCPVAENFHLNESLGFDICDILATDDQVDLMISAFHKVYENKEKLKKIEI